MMQEGLSSSDIWLLKLVVVPGVGLIATAFASLAIFYLKSLVQQVARLADEQQEFNTRLIKIETRVTVELERLIITSQNHDTRILELERAIGRHH